MKNRSLFIKASNRCMVAIITAVMVMSSTVATSIPVYAQEPSEAIQLTEGTDYIPYIEGNNSEVVQNNEGGDNPIALNNVAAGEVVDENNDKIDTNEGTVKDNKGSIELNVGTVVDNHGTVKNFYECDDMQGKVTNNYGTVTGKGSVENNYSTVTGEGSVTNNYGGTVGKDVTVTNNFWSVTMKADVTAVYPMYDSGFVRKDGVLYIQTKDERGEIQPEGKILFTPGDSHEINVKTQGAANTGDGFTYEVAKNANGSYTATITNITKNIKVNLDAFNLALYNKQIKPDPQPQPDPEPEPQNEKPSEGMDGPTTSSVVNVAVTSAKQVSSTKGYVLNNEEKAAFATTNEEALALAQGITLEDSGVINLACSPEMIAMAKIDILKNTSVNKSINGSGLQGLVVQAGNLAYADGRATRKSLTFEVGGTAPKDKVVILYYTPGDNTPHVVKATVRNDGKIKATLPVPCNYMIVR